MIKQALFPLFCSCILSVQAQESSLPYITTWQGNRQAAVCYTFDDACPNQFKTAIPILDRYKAPATFFVSQAFNPDWNVLTAISRNGHEIASHTQTHCNLTDEVAETEYAQSNRLIESKTGNKVYTLAYPFCNAPSDSITARYYLGARICSGQIRKIHPRQFHAYQLHCSGQRIRFYNRRKSGKAVQKYTPAKRMLHTSYPRNR